MHQNPSFPKTTTNRPTFIAMCDRINKLSPEDMHTAFYRITQSNVWAAALVKKAPFASSQDLFSAAVDIWMGLKEADQIESMDKRPLLGDTNAVTIDPYCRDEDNMNFVEDVDHAALKALLDYNKEYAAKFGFICIVFAKDLTPSQQILLMKLRVQHNDRATEQRVNVLEDAKITLFRLNRLLHGRDPWSLGQVKAH